MSSLPLPDRTWKKEFTSDVSQFFFIPKSKLSPIQFFFFTVNNWGRKVSDFSLRDGNNTSQQQYATHQTPGDAHALVGTVESKNFSSPSLASLL